MKVERFLHRETKETDQISVEPTSVEPDCREFLVHHRDVSYPLRVEDLSKHPHAKGDKVFYIRSGLGEIQIFLDKSIPRKFWEVVLLHEVVEYEARQRGFRNAHNEGVTKELEYAKNHLAHTEFKEYLHWKEDYFKEYQNSQK